MIAETKTPKLKVLYKLPKEWQWVPLGTATVAERNRVSDTSTILNRAVLNGNLPLLL